jgi:TAP-like protein
MRWLVQEQQAISGFADGFIGKLWPCTQWKMTAVERYSSSFEWIKTRFPIMFVNGRYDPVTPLSLAFNASAGFEGSAVLTHGGHGHKFFRHPSICTAKAVRAYFVNGTMPEEVAFCDADVGAFEVAAAGGEGTGIDEDAALRARGIMDEDDRRFV